MADFNEQNDLNNIGGNNTVKFKETFNISYLPEPIDHIINDSEIQTVGSLPWNTFYGSSNTIIPSIKPKDTNSGIIWDLILSLRYPKDQAAITNEFVKMLNKPYLIQVTNNNGITKLFGSIESPMKILFEILNPGEISGYDGYQVTFSGSQIHAPYYIE